MLEKYKINVVWILWLYIGKSGIIDDFKECKIHRSSSRNFKIDRQINEIFWKMDFISQWLYLLFFLVIISPVGFSKTTGKLQKIFGIFSIFGLKITYDKLFYPLPPKGANNIAWISNDFIANKKKNSSQLHLSSNLHKVC